MRRLNDATGLPSCGAGRLARHPRTHRPGNRSAAKRVIASIRDQNTILAEHAMIGRPGRVEGTRELVNSRYPYITVYRLRDGCVEILAVMHTSRRWPGSFGGKV